MSLKYKLIESVNIGRDKDLIPKKVYARSVYSEKVTFNALLNDIVEAGVPTSQVKAVIDRMNYMIRKHLIAGHIVQFGEFGNFRYSIGSTGAISEDEFKTSQIKRPKIIFTPNKSLKQTHLFVDFQRIGVSKEVDDQNCDRPHAD